MSLINATIGKAETDPQEYQKQDYGRGHPKFVMSYSSLKEFGRCPSRWLAGYQAEDSDSTDYGNLLDTLLLTPEKFENRFVVRPDTYTDEKGVVKPWSGNSLKCKAWLEDNKGRSVIKSDDRTEAKTAIAQLEKDTAILEYVQCSAKQVSISAAWQDKTTGITVPIRGLIDLVPDVKHSRYGKTIGDFKTARNASVRAWQKQVFEFNYHVQAALYLDVYTLATGEDRTDFRHIVQESMAPFQTAKRIVSQEYLELGREYYRMTLAKYCECIKTNTWPDYDNDSTQTIAGWTLTQPDAYMANS